MKRTAECACGQLKVVVQGDPVLVGACSCTACQKKTGGPFGLSSYFDKAAQLVSIEGEHKVYQRFADSGRGIEHHFCPECGSNVFWYAEVLPDTIGISAGNFTDPHFPPPETAAWDDTRYNWVQFPESIPILKAGRL